MSTPTVQTIRGYEPRERIGAGGFGEVYRAYQPAVGREVAIKVILPQYANHPDFIRRFETEAQLVARLEHPYIVPLYDYWREPDGAYLVMRWLRGGSLGDALAQAPWTPEAAAGLLDQVASGLAVAHRQGVVHRDVKPENILLDEEQNGYLSDFGIAKELMRATVATETGGITGSLAYISPEQARGEPVAVQSDLYSLGVVMYEVLTGEHPFPGATPATQLIKHLTEPLPPLQERRPDLPETLEEVIQRATAKDPAARFADALTFAAAFREALAGTPVPVVVPEPEQVSAELVNPYKGLRAFEEADAADFFGREALTQQLLARLGEDGSEDGANRFLAVVGPSGSGKSSVVKAGLLPALREGALPSSKRWFIVEMLPGTHPLDELEIGLLRVAATQPPNLMEQLQRDERGLLRAARLVLPTDEDELLLVIDQFEELFTRATDREESRHLLQSLCAAATDPRSPVRIIVTLRADFYDRPLMHPDFSRLMRQRTEVVVPLTADELAQAIQRPAERAGAELEPGLVTAIVADVSEQPGALPMLQYALTELFERRADRLLTREAYQAIGGVSGALARRAEEVYAGLDQAGQAAARQLFLRLVTLGEGVEDTRRRVLRTELQALIPNTQYPISNIQYPMPKPDSMLDSGYSSAMDAVIEVYGRHRLLTFDRDPATRAPTVEVAHEALLREWERLRGWLDESRADVRLQRLLAAAAEEWIEADRDPSFLLRGTRLAQFEGWAAGGAVALTQDERAYLAASVADREAREAEEAARIAREAALERRSRAILRALVAVMTLAAVIASALMVFAFNRQREALEAYSLSLAANAQHALSVRDTASGLVLALAANRIDQPPAESQRTLLEAAFAPGPRRRLQVTDIAKGVDGPPSSIAISPNGCTALTGLLDGTVVLWDLETGAEIRRLSGHSASVNDLAFSPDGKTALSGSDDATVILWDAATGREIRRFSGHSGAVRTVAFSPDGRAALSGGLSSASVEDPGELILWDLGTAQEIRRFEGHAEAVVDAAFSPDGHTALASSGEVMYITARMQEYSLILWNVGTGEIVHRSEGLAYDVPSVAISPDGNTALTASADHNVYLWDLTKNEQIRVLEGHGRLVTQVGFSPDGRRALSGADDGGLILWDLKSGEPIAHFQVHTGYINGLAFSHDSRTALSSSSDGTLILWDLFNAAEVNRFEGHAAPVLDAAFSPDGKTFLSASGRPDPGAPRIEDDNLRLWDLETGEQIRALELHDTDTFQAAVSPDGRQALSALMGEQSVGLWDLETGREIRRLVGHAAPVPSVAFTPDGRRGLSGALDGTLILWDLESGEAIRRFTGHEGGVWALTISPDGRTALSGADDRIVIWWDMETGEELCRFVGHSATVSGVAFSPDGRRAMSGDDAGDLILWDLDTGEQVRQFDGHGGGGDRGRTRVAFSPDGRTALSSGWDGTLALWDLETGKELRRFTGHDDDFIFDLAISPDGRTALSCATDSTIIQYQLATPSLDELFDWVGANRHVRELTCDERELYRIEPFCEE